MTDIKQDQLRPHLDALIELTAQFGLEQLVAIFVHNIRMTFPSKSIILLTEHGPTPMNQLALTEESLQGTVDHMLQKVNASKVTAQLNPSLRPATIINREQGKNWIQIPLHTNIGVIGFLQVAGDYSEHEIVLAETHIRVFINQLNLLSKNERDALTGLYNRQAFDERMKKLIHNDRDKRRDEPEQFVFAIIDIDHFKRINDTLGHLYGDEVLILFSRLLRESFRDMDWVFRYGGEEFAVLLYDCDLQTGKSILERLRTKVEAYRFPQLERVTCSIGATLLDKSQPLGVNIERADAALYYAKEHGRNSMYSYESLLAEGKLKHKDVVPGDIEIF